MSQEWSHVGVRLTGSLRQRLEELAENRSSSISDLVRRAVQMYLSGGADAWEKQERSRLERQLDTVMIPAIAPDVRVCGEWMCELPPEVRGFVLKIGSALESCDDVRRSQARWYEFLKTTPTLMWYAELSPPVDVGLPEEDVLRLALKNGRILECSNAWARRAGLPDASAVIGTRLGSVYDASGEPIRNVARQFMRSGYRLENVLLEFKNPAQETYRMACSLVGSIEAGLLVGVWAVGQPLRGDKTQVTVEALQEARL